MSLSCLVIKNDGIGDLIMASGLLRELAKYFDGNVDLVTCATNKFIAESIEGLRFKYYTSRESLNFSNLGQLLGFRIPRGSSQDIHMLQKLAKTHYNYAVCLRRYIRRSSLVLMGQVKAEQKFCLWQIPTNISSNFAQKFSKGWMRYNGSPHILSEMDYYRKFLEGEFEIPFDTRPRLSFLDDVPYRPIPKRVGLCIGGNRKWPIGYWLDLIYHLHSDGWSVVLLGGKDAEGLADIITRIHPVFENHVGKLPLNAATRILSRLEAFIGNDTGLTHLAGLIVPTVVVIMGGGGFGRFFPWPETDGQYIIFYGMDCYDCSWNCRYRERRCIEAIRASDIYDYFQSVLKGNATQFSNLNRHCPGYRQALCGENGKKVFVSFSKF